MKWLMDKEERMKSGKWFLLWLICGLLLGACSTLQHSQRVEVADGELTYASLGEGPVTIVLESGLGDGMQSWDGIFEPLSEISRVFAYSRPGYLPSSATLRPRTPQRIVDELRQLLRQSGHNPPYLLVGHSLGGLYVLDFVERYPQEVAGVVLVDARHPMTTESCRERGLSDCTMPRLLYALQASHVRLEYDGAQQPKMPATMGQIPLAVVSRAPDRGLPSAAWQSLWSEMQLSLSELSSRSRHMIASDAGHYVHRDQPEVVLEAVDWVYTSWQNGNAGQAGSTHSNGKEGSGLVRVDHWF
jgi:pimeloyl-ACP methyl ester carboxylesterase